MHTTDFLKRYSHILCFLNKFPITLFWVGSHHFGNGHRFIQCTPLTFLKDIATFCVFYIYFPFLCFGWVVTIFKMVIDLLPIFKSHLTSPTIHYTNIPQCTIFAPMCSFLLQNGALWDLWLVHCGICATVAGLIVISLVDKGRHHEMKQLICSKHTTKRSILW